MSFLFNAMTVCVSFKLSVRFVVSVYSSLLWFSNSVGSNWVFKTYNPFLIKGTRSFSISPSLIQLLELIFSQWFDLKHSMKLIVLYCPNKLKVPSWSSISLIEREISAVHVKCLSVWREAGSAGVLSSHIPGYIIGQGWRSLYNRTEKPWSRDPNLKSPQLNNLIEIRAMITYNICHHADEDGTQVISFEF